MLDRRAGLGDTVLEGARTIESLCALAARCEDLPGVHAAAVLLPSSGGQLSAVGSSAAEAGTGELFALMAEEGPGVDCLRRGQPVDCEDLSTAEGQWPRFAPAALARGFAAAHAMPMWPWGQQIGIVNLLRGSTGPLPADVERAARGFCQVTAFTIRDARRSYRLNRSGAEPARAIGSPVLVGQAAGVLAERHQISMSEALNRLLAYAGRYDQPISEAAALAVSGSPDFR
ncbi:GAF domain-containing protein [Allokutzneria albata]|nr:GAF domain-containing protein [Allokutzneria albata]